MPTPDEEAAQRLADRAAECKHIQTRSYALLNAVRERATEKRNYNSQTTRDDLQRLFTEKFGKPAYLWQLDITESILLGLDSVLIAGTGCGKTMPFMMVLLLDSRKMILVVSPLIVLQTDQVRVLFTLIVHLLTYR